MRKNGWQADGFEVMPNPWWDHGRMSAAARYLDELNERLLGPLVAYLNGVHELNASLRYWRVLIGPWLAWHLRAYYDRYAHLQEAFRRHPGFDTVLLPDLSFVTPEDTADHQNLLETDLFNFQIFSELLKNLGCSFQTVPGAAAKAPGALTPLEKPRGKLGFSNTRAPVVMLHEMYCDGAIVNRIIESLSPNACVFVSGQRRFTNLPRAEVNPRRLGLAQLPAGDEFQSLFVKSLPQNFPVLWLEGFDLVRGALIKPETVFPSVIISSNAWYDNEVFKFFSAHAAECGCRLAIVQHGGGYGVYRESFNEDHEARIADSYFVWGWSRDRKGVCQDAPCLQASDGMRHSSNSSVESKTKITFFSTDSTPYLQGFRSQPALDQWETYFEWQLRFFRGLPIKLHPHVLYRPYLTDYGRKIREKLQAVVPSVDIDDVRGGGAQNFQRLFGARVCVIDHNATTFLYSLAVNVPTILFWDPKLWPARAAAEPFFDELRQVGILWDTPEGAAVKVAAIWDDPALWWESPEVQAVRRRFTERFARSSHRWLDEWKKILLDELARAQNSQPKSCDSSGVDGQQTGIEGKQMIGDKDGHVPATEVDGYRIEMWKSPSEIGQIEYAAYWNNESEEVKKDVFWIFDGNFRKMEEYLGQTYLIPQLNQMLEFVRITLGRSLAGTGADLAAGNLWAVPHVLKAGQVRRIYAVEYSLHRLVKIGPLVLKGYGISKEKVVLCVGSFYDLKIPTASLDFVFMSQAFHHADEPITLLNEIRRVLRPGGLVIMIGEHVVEAPKSGAESEHLKRLAGHPWGEPLRSWKPTLPHDPVLGDHFYCDEEFHALFVANRFRYHNLRFGASRFQSFLLVRDETPWQTNLRQESIQTKRQLSDALSRLNRRGLG